VPLTKILREKGALNAARAANITKQVADGLAAAHDLGIVHRDLKPDNIMVAKTRDGGDQIKIVDFGIAKAMQSDEQKVTRTGLSIGTPEYMSPEQLAGDNMDHRTDIYSLGLVAFSMFTGHLPFPSVTSKEALIMRLTDRPRTLAQIKSDIEWPAELQRVMDRSLANDADQRYQHVADFGRDIVKAVETMPRDSFTNAGTVEFAAPTAPTQALVTGSGGKVTEGPRTSTSKPSTGTGAPVEPVSRGRGGLWAALIVVALAGGGGAYWYVTQQQSAAPAPAPAPVAAVVDSAALVATATDSAALATAAASTDSGAAAGATTPATDTKAAATDTKTPATDTKTATAEPAPIDPDASTLAEMRESIRSDIAEARTFAEDGDYVTASTRLRRAQQQLQPLVNRFPRSRRLQEVSTTLRNASRDLKSACEAERKLDEEVVCP